MPILTVILISTAITAGLGLVLRLAYGRSMMCERRRRQREVAERS